MPGADGVTSARRPHSVPALSERRLVLITALAALPILWLGYGTDIDIEALLRAGEGIRNGDYEPSRIPGVPVVEALVGVLDPLGGHLAINLATALALVATVVGCARLVHTFGRPNGELVALAFLACPPALIAGTSTTDFIWALALFVWGALALLQSRSVMAGALLGLSVGARSSTVLLVIALVVADAWTPAHRRRSATTAAVAGPLAILLYVPAWLAYDRSLTVLDDTNGWQGLANNLGRFLYKNYATAGPVALVVLAVALPALLHSLRRWPVDPLVRFAALGFLLSEALYLVMPWKLAHLLPCLLCLLLWLSSTEWNRPAYLWALVAALALNGVVALRPLVPDDPDASRSARVDPALTMGLLLNDVRCRARHMDEPPSLESEAWPCSLEPLRGVAEPREP